MPRHTDPQTALGEVIRQRRQELGLSQEQVGLAARSSQARISAVESGQNPSYQLTGQIARALGWTHSELVRRVEEHEARGPR